MLVQYLLIGGEIVEAVLAEEAFEEEMLLVEVLAEEVLVEHILVEEVLVYFKQKMCLLLEKVVSSPEEWLVTVG